MTKKHFIELAHTMIAIRERAKGGLIEVDEVERQLASFCSSQNYRFDRGRWLAYIKGECGPYGGTVRQPKEVSNASNND